ncbi:MAG: TlpA disulfide reductase family protein [Clostridia bacterium]
MKKINKKILLYVLIFLLFICILFLLYHFKDYIIKKEIPINNNYKSEYINLNNRNHYILNIVDETLLKKYIDKDKTLVVFSASWCKYCVEEQDDLNKYIQENPDKTIIIVSHDRSYEDIDNYLKTNNFNWFVIFDSDKIIRESIDPNSSGIPTMYLLDNNSIVIDKLVGDVTFNEIEEFYNEK